VREKNTTLLVNNTVQAVEGNRKDFLSVNHIELRHYSFVHFHFNHLHSMIRAALLEENLHRVQQPLYLGVAP
jgi:hypothetical protein